MFDGKYLISVRTALDFPNHKRVPESLLPNDGFCLTAGRMFRTLYCLQLISKH